MNKQGFVEKTDVDQLELTINNLMNAINQVRSNLDIGYRLFKIILGLDINARVKLIDSLEANTSLPVAVAPLMSQSFNKFLRIRLILNGFIYSVIPTLVFKVVYLFL